MKYLLEKTDALHQCFSNEATKFSFRPNLSGQSLSDFSLTNPSSVSELILQAKSSTCHLDPEPTPLLKWCHCVISAPISHFITLSLTSALFPVPLKTATFTPVFKKKHLSSFIVQSNYRPISNIPVIAEIIGKYCCLPASVFSS